MLGTKTIGRSVVFGLGYLAGTRAGRARYDQIQQAARVLRRPAASAARRDARQVARLPCRRGPPGLGRQRHQARAAVNPRCWSASTS